MIEELKITIDDMNDNNIKEIKQKINEIIDAMNQHNHFEDYINNPEEYDKQEENKCISCQEYNTETCGYCVDYKLYKLIQKPKQLWQKKLEEIEVNLKEYIEYIESKEIYDVNIKIIIKKYKQIISELIKDNEEKNKFIQIKNNLIETLKQEYRENIEEIQKLQQKQLPKGCIEWLKYKKEIGNSQDIIISRKLLKYFKELK